MHNDFNPSQLLTLFKHGVSAIITSWFIKYRIFRYR